jgi:hypothetical protein
MSYAGLRRVFFILTLLVGGIAKADLAQPVKVQIVEREPGLYAVKWQVPRVLPVHAMPVPDLGEDAKPVGSRKITDHPGGWSNRQSFRITGDLFGRKVGLRYPYHNPSLSALIRVDLLSGEQYAHWLSPADEYWQVPAGSRGPLQDFLMDSHQGTLSGLKHIVTQWFHLAFVFVIALAGRWRDAVKWVTVFLVAQIAGILIASFWSGNLQGGFGELGLVVAVLLMAAENLKSAPDLRKITLFAGLAGLWHGVGMNALLPEASWAHVLGAVVGMDGALLVLSGIGAMLVERALRSMPGVKKVLVYGTASATVCMALVLFPHMRSSMAGTRAVASTLPAGPAQANDTPASRAVAPQNRNTPLQSFVSIGAFEVRHEVLMRWRDLAYLIDPAHSRSSVIDPVVQPEIKMRISDFVADHCILSINGDSATPLFRRVDFVTADPKGIWPRIEPVPESLKSALVGVTFAYATSTTPDQVMISWQGVYGAAESVPVSVTDPEATASVTLRADNPQANWTNELVEDPLPNVRSATIEPELLHVPTVSLILLVSGLILYSLPRLRTRTGSYLSAGRLLFLAASLTVPIAQLAVVLPSGEGATPSAGQARRILARMLPNVYRAFEFGEEGAVYDRLALTVTGNTLTDIYLAHRGALEMTERGGARARVEAVEVKDAHSVSKSGEGFVAQARWTVGGTVTHFGHRHFRQNMYDAHVHVVPVDGVWKLSKLEVLEQQRIR